MSFTKSRSEKLLKKTFILMLHEEPIENINVSKLTSRSNLCRSTFYLYFKDIDELLYIICFELLTPIYNSIEKIKLSRNSGNTNLIKKELISIFQFVKQKKLWYTSILKNDKKMLFHNHFESMVYELISPCNRLYPHGKCFYHALSSAIFDLIVIQLKDSDKEGDEYIKALDQLLTAIF